MRSKPKPKERPKNAAAQALAALRTASLTPQRRSEIASMGGLARHAARRKKRLEAAAADKS